MSLCFAKGGDKFIVPTEQKGLELLPPSFEDWFQQLKNHTNLSSNSSVSPIKESKVSTVHLGEGSSINSSPCDDGLLLGCSMKTDDFFNDLPDFEMQNSMQNIESLHSFIEQTPKDLLENPYGLEHILDFKHSVWNWRFTIDDGDSDTMMEDLTRGKNLELNSKIPNIGDPNGATESFITSVINESVAMEATILQELENVMIQLNRRTRLCIRDSLYRLADSSKEQHSLNLCQSGICKDLFSCSYCYCGNSRQEPLDSSQPKSNAVDRIIATLMYCSPDYK